jgi:hypothetical protein
MNITAEENTLMKLAAEQTHLRLRSTQPSPPDGIWTRLQELDRQIKEAQKVLWENPDYQSPGEEGVTARGVIYMQYLELFNNAN